MPANEIVLDGYRLPLAPVPESFQEYDRDYWGDLFADGDDSRLAAEGKARWVSFAGGLGPQVYDPNQPDTYLYSKNADCRFGAVLPSLLVQEATVTGMTTGPTGFFTAEPGLSFAWNGTKLWRTTSGTAWGASVLTAAANITAMAELDGTYLVADGTSNRFYYSTDDGATWTQQPGGGADSQPKFMLTGRNSSGVAVAAFLYTNTIKTTANPTTNPPTYSGATTVCSSTNPITGAYLSNGIIKVLTAQGVYAANIGLGTVLVTPLGAGLATTPDPTDPAPGCQWLSTGADYVPRNLQVQRLEDSLVNGLTPVDPRIDFSAVGFEHQRENDSELRGRIISLVPHDRWLFCLLKTNHTTPRYWILSYEERDGRPVWHTINYLGTETCTALGWFQNSSSTGNSYLLVSRPSGIGYITQPVGSHDPRADTSGNVRYVNQGTVFLPDYYGRDMSLRKWALAGYASVVGTDNANGMSVSLGYQLHTRADGEGDVASLGQVVSSGAPLAFPNDEDSDSEFEHIHPHITVRCDTAAGPPPQCKGFVLEFEQESLVQWWHEVKLLTGLETVPGTDLSATFLNRLLRQWRRGGVLEYTDPDDLTHHVRVRAVSKVATQKPAGPDAKPVYYRAVLLRLFRTQEDNGSVYWDEGAAYDEDNVEWG